MPASSIADDCAHEAIQLLGTIQPHGFLLECSPDWIVTRASTNIRSFLPVEHEELLGRSLVEIVGQRLIHDLRGRLQLVTGRQVVEYLFDCAMPGVDTRFDLSIHQFDGAIVIEGEPVDPDDAAIANTAQALLAQLRHQTSITQLARTLVRQMRALTGYDRVMVYRFHPDASGEVIAEAKRSDQTSFLALRYPASDIPAQARALYVRNPIRVIVDIDADPVPVEPRHDLDGRPIDLSMAGLRSVSRVHIEYLRNMGVGASMSLSIVVGGALWGLISCHHDTARRVSMRRRHALEFFGQMVSSILESIARAEEITRQSDVRQIHNRMLSQLAADSGSIDDILPQLENVQAMLGADGFATFVDDRLRLTGATPSDPQTRALMRFLNRATASQVYATHSLASIHPAAADYADTASGVLAIPVSRRPRDYVVFFRRELPRHVTWAGEPKKTMQEIDGQMRLGPRNSFAAWRETVRQQSAHWSSADLDIAEALRVTLLELMLQVTDHAEKQRKQSNDQQDLLIAELNHRVRNILNLIVGLVRQCADGADTIESFSEEVSNRVHALARAHDQLTSSGWGARSVRNMIRVEAGAYLADKADRVRITGDEMGILPDAFATVALVMHELITNAAKYGAFRDSHGTVDIRLECDDERGMTIDWRERGGAAVKAPTRRGFGSTIIERAIPHELGGSAIVEFDPDGLHARFEIPSHYLAECVHADEIEASHDHLPLAETQSLSGSVLLIEDNLLIALETETMLHSLGAEDVHVFSTVAAALAHLEVDRPSFAVLDYNLGREQSVAVAQRLDAMAVPFVFATGYGDTATIDDRFRDRPILTKPYTEINVKRGFAAALRTIEAEDPESV